MKCRKCAKPINLQESTYLTILLFRSYCLLKSFMFYVKLMNKFQGCIFSMNIFADNFVDLTLYILTKYDGINYQILIARTHSKWCGVCHRISWKNRARRLSGRFSSNIMRSSSVHVSPIL